MGTVEPQVSAPADVPQAEQIDGFHLVIEALKLNGIDTVFGLPGIPITDLTRMLQAEGVRVISFRHEQNAGNAAAIAGFMTQKPGICLTVSAPGFLNGLTAAQIDGSEDRDIHLKIAGQETVLKGQRYLLNFALPHFYFHATTTYAILRSCGVEIGKRDYIGAY